MLARGMTVKHATNGGVLVDQLLGLFRRDIDQRNGRLLIKLIKQRRQLLGLAVSRVE